MCLLTDRWLIGAFLSAGLLLGAHCAPVVAQDAEFPEPAVLDAGEADADTVLMTTVTLPEQMDSVGEATDRSAPSAPDAVAEEPLVPIPDPASGAPVAIEAASFKGVTPGVTAVEEVEKTWGAPREVSKRGTTLHQLFSVEPFDRIEVSYFEGKVASVVIRFDQAFPANTVAEQLELTNVRPVLVSNELGEILGQVYPERGVLFAFTPSGEPGKASMQVGQIILEPISAEPFVLRAETNVSLHYDLALQDIDQALKLDPTIARSHWLRARLLAATGDPVAAEKASAEAVRLDQNDAQFAVTRAQILATLGRLGEAREMAQHAVEKSEHRPHVRVRALCMLGDLAASGPEPDFRKAIEFHTQAVQQAGAIASDPHPAIRLAAKEVLVDAHLGAAHDIAWGEWKEKEVALERWLTQAEGFATDLVEKEGRSEELLFRVSTRALAAYVGVRGKLDPTDWADTAVRTGQKLIAEADDPLRKSRFQWDLGMALYDALQSCQMRNDHDAALKYGERAIEYLEQGEKENPSVAGGYLLGRLYFRLGAIHAIRDENHEVAVTWFDKAMPLLSAPGAGEANAEAGRCGETFVSMGVSYWEAGQREKAVQVTQTGLEMMEGAVELGQLDPKALSVPYNNLASMHRQLGSQENAEQYEAMAARIRDTRVQ